METGDQPSAENEAPGAGASRGRRRLAPGRRRRLQVAGVAVAGIVVAAGIWAAVSQGGRSSGRALTGVTDSPAPAFSLPGLTDAGRTVSLESLRGHDVVLNFWASWCFPCQAEMPVLQAAHRADPTVLFVGVDTNDTRAAAMGFLGRVHVSYQTLYDPHGSTATAYGLVGLPTTVFVSRQGKVVGRHAGQLDAATLAAALRQAFGAAA